MKRVLGLIPARGGSKGLPHKNIRTLQGRTLVHRAWESAIASGVLDRVILSTDDQTIVEHACTIGLEVPFTRPADLARDETPMIDVVVHALDTLREQEGYVPDAVLLLQPTSPLRTSRHIHEALSLLMGYDAVCSVLPLPQDLSPYYLMKIREDGCLDFFMPDGAGFTRRQDLPIAYRREGTIFLTRKDVLLEERSFYGRRCRPMFMVPEEVLNIDSAEDWAIAEHLFRERDL